MSQAPNILTPPQGVGEPLEDPQPLQGPPTAEQVEAEQTTADVDLTPDTTVQSLGGDFDLVMPVSGVTPDQLSDTFGAPRSNGRSHRGVDIFSELGTPVVSAKTGTVIRVGTAADGNIGGNRVTVRGEDGNLYYYAHLNNITVSEGETLRQGEALGTVGQTGNAAGTAPQLHFSIGENAVEDGSINAFQALQGATVTEARVDVSTFEGSALPADIDEIEAAGVRAPTGLDIPENASDEEVKRLLRQNFGYLAWSLETPEVGEILIQAAREKWSPQRLQGAISQTDWFQNTSRSIRQWQSLQGEDPATARRQVDQRSDEISRMTQRLGLGLDPERIHSLATDSLRLGWDAQDIQRAVAAEADFDPQVDRSRGEVGATVNELISVARDNFLLPFTRRQAAEWSKRILAGEATKGGFETHVRNLAASRYETFADEIGRGITPAALFDSYKQMAAETLEMDSDQIDLVGDPRFSVALETTGQDGKRRAMSLNEFQRHLRGLPAWRNTQNARRSVSDLTTSVSRIFGKGGI